MGKVMENLINGHEPIGYGTQKRSQARATVAELRINIDRKVVTRLPDHKGGPHVIIVHARKVRTKGGKVFFLVKLVSSDKQDFVVLKFDKDGVLVTS